MQKNYAAGAGQSLTQGQRALQGSSPRDPLYVVPRAPTSSFPGLQHVGRGAVEVRLFKW